MRGINDTHLSRVDNLDMQETIDWVNLMGYSTEALSNEEIYELAESILDGFADEPSEVEGLWLDFSGD